MPKRKKPSSRAVSTGKTQPNLLIAQAPLPRIPPFIVSRRNRYFGSVAGIRDFIFTTGFASQLLGICIPTVGGVNAVGLCNTIRIKAVTVTIAPSEQGAGTFSPVASCNLKWGSLPTVPFSSAVTGGIAAGPPQVHNITTMGSVGSASMRCTPPKDSFIREWFCPGSVVAANDRIFIISVDGVAANIVSIYVDIEYDVVVLVTQDAAGNYAPNATWTLTNVSFPAVVGSAVCAAYAGTASTFPLTPQCDMNY